MDVQRLYHYYERETGPFKNLSDLSLEEAAIIQNRLKHEQVLPANGPTTICLSAPNWKARQESCSSAKEESRFGSGRIT